MCPVAAKKKGVLEALRNGTRSERQKEEGNRRREAAIPEELFPSVRKGGERGGRSARKEGNCTYRRRTQEGTCTGYETHKKGGPSPEKKILNLGKGCREK